MDQHTPLQFISASFPDAEPGRDRLSRLYHADETALVSELLAAAELREDAAHRVQKLAQDLVKCVRGRREDQGPLEAFMQEYDLSSEEGVILMCLAEALLRIPDADTAESLIADKLSVANWESHLGKSQSVFVNASTWGLMLTGKLVRLGEDSQRGMGRILGRMVNRSGEPVVRSAIRQAMRIMGFQYVMGRNIEEALDRSVKRKNRMYRYSFDMLGEAALTQPDADRYFEAYQSGIVSIGRRRNEQDIFSAASISVKLSALHPRYEVSQRERVIRELVPRLRALALLAKKHDVALTVDAEEADRLMLSLDVYAEVLRTEELEGWDGFGLAIQSYLKMAGGVIDVLVALARETRHRLPVRLVKGAYWDSEVKHAQEEGFPGYPVFTRKANTDVSYIACARKMLAHRAEFYPQFATHNAHTIAVISELAGDRLDFEFQRLHGMGEDLYGEVLAHANFNGACRVYAPVGSHEDLLPYLVRRLLENGANTSFVNRIVDDKLPIDQVVEDPVAKVRATRPVPHPSIPLPVQLYGAERRNSMGRNLANEAGARALAAEMGQWAEHQWQARPLLGSSLKVPSGGETERVVNPANNRDTVGEVKLSVAADIEQALAEAHRYQVTWDGVPASERAAALERAASQLEDNMPQFMVLLTREAGKTLEDGIAEIREAVDFLRYYAYQARIGFEHARELPGPTGERNELSLHGRGVVVCISPWNFPLAIFLGQVSAALAAGNTVIAKPAEATPLVAYRAVELLHEAGIPRAALQLLPGYGKEIGDVLMADRRVAGVAFTGSTLTARHINLALAQREGPLATLIAETGGQNAMLVDSSALPEQVVKDVIASAFHSAGQRCSALRVLFLQTDIADKIIEMLAGAMEELVVGDPRWLKTDVGPIIDEKARRKLQAHVKRMESEAKLLARASSGEESLGYFIAPCAFEIESLQQLEDEVFGPILHVIRYHSGEIDRIIEGINATGYGLTLGVHSRVDRFQMYVANRVRAGNRYINRTMTGAVVGVQPFGGEGLSGTGPKAGGPHYLLRFATERTLTTNTAAVGGNASLLAMED